MKERVEDVLTYEELNEKINDLSLNELLKEGLNDVNNNICKLKKYNLDFTINIIINNCSKQNIEILLENISHIINSYNLNKKIVNFSEIESSNIEDYSKDIIVIDDYNLFKTEEKIDSHKYYTFKRMLSKSSINLIMTCEGDFKDFYADLFGNNLENIINNSIILHDEEKNIDDLVRDITKKYQENDINYEINNDELKEIILYFLNEKYCYNSNCVDYVYKISTKSMLLKKQNAINITCFEQYPKNNNGNNKSNELNDLIGLDNIKKEIESLKNYLIFKKKCSGNFDKTYLNMFFMGEPGTGKTTVARAITNILYELNYLEKDKIVEIIPTDLMANYVGQTKDKTREILRKAKGGLLFIDEAYLIYQSNGRERSSSFMNEAVVELMKYLEDPKNVVIFAGYPNEMKKIYECNPGIKSRIYKEIYFDNYSVEELYSIIEKNLDKMNIKVNNDAKKKILSILKQVRLEKGFGNARFCEQYAQKLVINHANRKLKKETYTITLADVYEFESLSNKKMGFVGDNYV